MIFVFVCFIVRFGLGGRGFSFSKVDFSLQGRVFQGVGEKGFFQDCVCLGGVVKFGCQDRKVRYVIRQYEMGLVFFMGSVGDEDDIFFSVVCFQFGFFRGFQGLQFFGSIVFLGRLFIYVFQKLFFNISLVMCRVCFSGQGSLRFV